jgi:hypothetical protein
MDATEFDTYPVRPPPEEGESLPGYCWRFFAANGHEVPRTIRKAMLSSRVVDPAPVVATDASRANVINAESIRKLVNASLGRLHTAPEVELIRRHFGSARIDPILEAEWAVSGMMERRGGYGWLMWPRFSRHCPSCLAERRGHLLVNDLPLVRACPLHGTRLICHCVHCSEPFSWRLVSAQSLCVCGVPFAEMAQPAPSWRHRLSRAVQQALLRTATRKTNSEVEHADAAHGSIDLGKVYDELWWSANLHHALRCSRNTGGSSADSLFGRKRNLIPARWEVDLVSHSASAIVDRANRVLQRVWRRRRSAIVLVDKDECFIAVARLLARLPDETQTFARKMRAAFSRVISDHVVAIEGLGDMLTYPGQPARRRDQQLQVFKGWWSRVVRRLEPCESDTELPRDLGRAEYEHGVDVDARYDLVVGILNALLSASQVPVPADRLVALRHRWRPPACVVEASDSLSSLASKLTRLADVELAFARALIDKDLSRVGALHGG